VRRYREDELDLADIGGEAGTTTHGASIAGPGRGRQAAGRRAGCNPRREPLREHPEKPERERSRLTFPEDARWNA
jgi:hypothetical protein